jgi:hypothetical protein
MSTTFIAGIGTILVCTIFVIVRIVLAGVKVELQSSCR